MARYAKLTDKEINVTIEEAIPASTNKSQTLWGVG
jgi:hypothetical protein